jgi:predicted translin family RNA/ssDNA-binding protein
MKRRSPTDQETILLALRQDLEAARKRAAIASADFDEVIKNLPSGLPYRYSTHRIHRASSEYVEAQTTAFAALMRLNEFLNYGTLPPGGRRTGSMST